jgi:dUTP pyrophosphatase
MEENTNKDKVIQFKEGKEKAEEKVEEKVEEKISKDENKTKINETDKITNLLIKSFAIKDMKGTPLDEKAYKEATQEFTFLLSMPDKQFAILSGLVLEELEKSLRNSNDKQKIKNTLANQGVTNKFFKSLVTSVDEFDVAFKGKISQIKIDFIKRLVTLTYDCLYGDLNDFITIPIEISKERKMPCYAHATDAGMDIYAAEDYTIDPNTTVLVQTGIKVAIPQGYEIQVRPKSGISLKTGLRVANAPGTIDAGYRGEIGIIIDNIDAKIKDLTVDENGKVTSILYGKSYAIEKDSKIAQLVVSKLTKGNFQEVEKIETIAGDRGGGYGSTGLE